jgi:hypothetical protein
MNAKCLLWEDGAGLSIFCLIHTHINIEFHHILLKLMTIIQSQENNRQTRISHDPVPSNQDFSEPIRILLSEVEDARRTVDNQYAQLPVRRLEHNEHFRATRLGARRTQCDHNSTLGRDLLISSSIHKLVSTRVMYRRQLEDQQLPRVSSSTGAELASSHLYGTRDTARQHAECGVERK